MNTNKLRLAYSAVTAAVVLATLMLPGQAIAGTSLAVAVVYPASAAVGQTDVPVTLLIINSSTGTEATGPLRVDSITHTPACGSGSMTCPGGFEQPGVFSFNAGAIGVSTSATDQACLGLTFAVNVINVSTGQVALTPIEIANVILGPPSSATQSCRIAFTVDVLALPTIDTSVVLPDAQTQPSATTSATSLVTSLSGSAFTATQLTVLPAAAAKSLEKCSKATSKEVLKFVGSYRKALSTCLDKVTNALVVDGTSSVAPAAKTCASSLRKILNSEQPDMTLAAKFAAKLSATCDPNDPAMKVAHSEAGVLDPGNNAGLKAANLGGYCSNFGGSGSIDSVGDWIQCAEQAAICNALQQIGVAYPRASEWLAGIVAPILALDPSDPKNIDAANIAAAVRVRLDSNLDGEPDIFCGGS